MASRSWLSAFCVILVVVSGVSAQNRPEVKEPSRAARAELERHQGTWRVEEMVRDGEGSDPEIARSIVRVVEGDHVVWERDGKRFSGSTMVLDAACEPATIDVIPDGGPAQGKRVLGIYKLDGDVLTICMADVDGARPKEFTAEKGAKQTLTVFRRERTVAKP